MKSFKYLLKTSIDTDDPEKIEKRKEQLNDLLRSSKLTSAFYIAKESKKVQKKDEK
jgi:hypothetical protein